MITLPVRFGCGARHLEVAANKASNALLFDKRLYRLNGGQCVVIGVAIDCPGSMNERPILRSFTYSGSAPVKRIGAIARSVRIPARGHAQCVINGDRLARIFFSNAQSSTVFDIGCAVLHSNAYD